MDREINRESESKQCQERGKRGGKEGKEIREMVVCVLDNSCSSGDLIAFSFNHFSPNPRAWRSNPLNIRSVDLGKLGAVVVQQHTSRQKLVECQGPQPCPHTTPLLPETHTQQ